MRIFYIFCRPFVKSDLTGMLHKQYQHMTYHIDIPIVQARVASIGVVVSSMSLP